MTVDQSTQARRSRKWRATAIAATLAATMSISGVAQACLNGIVPNHTLALSVRTLQSDLMVSALSCNERDRYNAFAVKYRPHLQKHGSALKDYFNKLHGSAATRELNAYVTDLANYASVRHAQDRKAFCGGTVSAFKALLIEKDVDIHRVALAYSMRVSPSLKQEITLAAASGGCDVVAQGSTVAAGGITILE
ncbi:hypothetical protein [Pacificispira sp.]|uniref:hypothetical protein n=1 Tax=Pacificispira sp. TaxID=2888761 RepID=UPI003BAB3ECE